MIGATNMPDHTRIIISDLHIGRNDDFDIFKSATKAAALSGLLSSVDDQSVELVVNGDFVDFLQLTPWKGIGRETALKKIGEIAQASAYAFDIFGKFLSNPEHRMVVLLGNHDVELAYPEVWAKVETSILASAPGAGDRLKLVGLRNVYRPRVNGVMAHIEHGNGDDPWNALDYGRLFNDSETYAKKFAYPPGTDFVFDVMNDFKEYFRFVDLLKPEMPAVPLILLALKPSEAARKLPKAAQDALKMLGNGLVTWLRKLVGVRALAAKRVAGPLSPRDQLGQTMAALYVAAGKGGRPARGLAAGRRAAVNAEDVRKYLASRRVAGPARLALALPGFGFVKMRLLAAALGALERFQTVKDPATYYKADHPKNEAAVWAKSRFEGDIRVVVFGHTHEALKTEFKEGLYLNSGAWANLIEMPRGDDKVLEQWLEKIAANQFDVTSFPTYVKLAPQGRGITASLNAWTGGKEQVLWQKGVPA